VNERKPRYPTMTRSGGLYWMRIRGNYAHDPLSCTRVASQPERIRLAEALPTLASGLGPVRARSGPRAWAERLSDRSSRAAVSLRRGSISGRATADLFDLPASGYRDCFALRRRRFKFGESPRLGFKINARLCCTCSFVSRL